MRDYAWVAVSVVMLAIVLAAWGNYATGVVTWYDDSTSVAQRAGGNFISGGGVTVTSADNPSSSRVDFTLSSSAQTGTATVSSGNTTTTVTHGFGATPDRVFLTPRANPGAMWWTSAIGATTFQINLAGAAGVDIAFDWRAGEDE